MELGRVAWDGIVCMGNQERRCAFRAAGVGAVAVSRPCASGRDSRSRLNKCNGCRTTRAKYSEG